MHFEVIEGRDTAYFAALPSKTTEARPALFAGSLAEGWLDPTGKPTRVERALAARNLKLTRREADALRFITEAQTTSARRKMGFKDSDAAPFNVLIYPISDELSHFHRDTLTTINSRIRQEMLGDREQNLRGILDDLLRRISPHDVVLVTSDHGFIELLPNRSIGITAAETRAAGRELEEAAHYRYLCNYERGDLQPVVRVAWDASTNYVLPVGTLWFLREQGKPARYAHGGVSMAEMVVPGVLLRRITEKEARLEYVGLPRTVEVQEDGTAALAFTLENVGNVDVDYELTGVTNLGEQVLAESGRVSPNRKVKVKCELLGRYAEGANREPVPEKTTRSLSVVLKHTDIDGRIREPVNGRVVIPVRVQPKTLKIETDALKGFDSV